MRDPLFWVPVKYKLPLTFAALCLIALGAGGYLVAITAEQALEDQILARLDDLSAITTVVVDRHLELLGRRVEDFASDGLIRAELAHLVANRAADLPKEMESTRAVLVRHLVANKLPLVDVFVDASLLDRQGEPLLQVYSHEPPPSASRETAALWFGPLQAPSGDHPYPTFLLSTPVKSLEGDRQIGFLQILVRADVWASSLRRGGLPSRSSSRIWLEDAAGSTSLLLSKVSGAQVDVAPQGSGTIDFVTTIARSGWRLQLTVDRDVVMEPIRNLLSRFLLVAGVLLLLIMAIWFFPSRFLLKPLAVLQDAARRIAEGDFSVRVLIDSRDEVGDLSRSFNIMAQAVEERTAKLEEAAAVLKRRERDIRFERDRLNAVIGSMHDGLFILDLKGQITLSNAAAEPLVSALKRDGERLVCSFGAGEGGSCLGFLADLDKPPQSCLVNLGARAYEIHATTLAAADGQVVGRVCVSRDISERIARAEQQAHQERMSVLGEIAAGVAHEVNNPLAAITMFSQMLETELEPESSFREHAEVIRRNAESCKRTIRGLLDLATARGAEIAAFDIHDLLHDVRRFLSPLYERLPVEFGLEAGAKNSIVVGDELQLRQVVVNLVMNAIQASDGRAVNVSVMTEDSGDSIAILVSDTGPGIPDEARDRIFEPFFTTKPRGAGTGLGLSTSMRIVETHGGTLKLVASEPGRTVFRVLLPRKGRPRFQEPTTGVAAVSERAEELGSIRGENRG